MVEDPVKKLRTLDGLIDNTLYLRVSDGGGTCKEAEDPGWFNSEHTVPQG